MPFLLLANSNIDSNQRLPILSAATSQKSTTTDTKPITDQELTKLVKYDPIASILRQCDNHSSSSNTKPTNAFAGRVRQPFRRATAQRLAEVKAKSQCRLCKNWGHWDSDHNRDGSLNPEINS